MITLTVNGKTRLIEGPTRLDDFLKDNNIDSEYVAVAHNHVVLDRLGFSEVTLQDGDDIEIVQPVGGG